MEIKEIVCKKSFKTSNNIRFEKGKTYQIRAINFHCGGTQIFRIHHESGLGFCSIPSVINKFFNIKNSEK